MHGLVYEIFEEWVLEQQGVNAWHAIKAKAGCDVQDQAFVTRTFYSYDSWVDLITAAADVLDSSFDTILEAYGHFNIRYHFSHGYDALLKCQGSTLRQWLSNLNAMHDHIQKSFPGGNFCPPVFWCEDSDSEAYEGSILLHYYSQRGNRLVAWVVGIVKELASYHFRVEIDMERLSLQDVDGSSFTTWRIVATDPTQTWKLSPKVSHNVDEEEVNFDDVPLPAKCPFSGRKLKKKTIETKEIKEPTAQCPFPQSQDTKTSTLEISEESDASTSKCPFPHHQIIKASADETVDTADSSMTSSEDFAGVSYDRMKDIFPFHVLVNNDFHVVQVGSKLPKLLQRRASEMMGSHINKFLEITKPVLGTSWNWNNMKKLADQNFILSPLIATKPLGRKVVMSDERTKFKASMVETSHERVMFVLSPEVSNVTELNNMGLTLSDLPLQSNQRDAVFLGEYVTQEADKAHKLDKLSRKLDEEKNLSNTLLHSIIPHKVADDLRRGKTVDPVFHENVTLFFSDIVGFTKICDQVEPWDVIDMMNQLFSIMDYLAAHFNLYKVETVGDAYMCCSGLPEPDEFHAENVTNFALAVIECTKHVKSPVDGSPVKMRIGIHTGSCTSGVVGTMTPHYCLFGDMVNVTARHESTGIPGKIHCSSVLFSRLRTFAKLDEPLYNFKARGLVDMKGKGQNYTYFVESGTEFNRGANSEALAELSKQAEHMIASKTWKKRKYFRKGGLVDTLSVAENSMSSQSESSGSGPEEESSIGCIVETLSPQDEGNGSFCSCDSLLEGDIDLDEDDTAGSGPTIIDLSDEQRLHFGKSWESIKWDETLTLEQSLERITDVLSSCLQQCVHKSANRMETVIAELEEFVKRIAYLYNANNPYHNFDQAAQAFTRAIYLWDVWVTSRIDQNKSFYDNPWDRFALLFCVLIHGIGHEGVANAQLEAEKHVYFQLNPGRGAYQQRYAFITAFELLEEDFADLYEEIIFGCPSFRGSLRKLMVATDIETEEKLLAIVQEYDALTENESMDARGVKELNDSKLCLVVCTAMIGHYTQSYDAFIQRNQLQFEEILKAFRNDRAEDPRDSWFYEQNMYFKNAVVPLITRMQDVFPSLGYVQKLVKANTILWGDTGREWVAATRLPGAIVGSTSAKKYCDMSMESLIANNVDILETLLRDVAASHDSTTPFDTGLSRQSIGATNPVDEIKLVIEMKKVKSDSNSNQATPELSPEVRSELRDFVVQIANGYEGNQFHNFMHASHVTHLANLLLTGIHAKEGSKDASGIAHDPVAKFAIVLSALVHDVGHTGIPNRQLADENPGLAERYNNMSIAEQNSIDTAWAILMSDTYRNLHKCLFESLEEKQRLRHLLVNCVMATDIFDQNLRETRKIRWEKVFHKNSAASYEDDESNTKATIVIEQLMQASDVSHTMQKWELYQEWNENLFNELYDAHQDGRTPKDPSSNWYNGELWFFDNWVIPLAENLRECGVLDIVSNQLIKQAHSNRKQWELEGKQITEALTKAAIARHKQRSAPRIPSVTSSTSLSSLASTTSHGSELILTSRIISEVETLSKVVRRYERKIETACGNLIAVAYKGQLGSEELKGQPWDKIHSHFKQQEWYRMHSDDGFSLPDGSEVLAFRDPSGRSGSRMVQCLMEDLSDELSEVENIVNG
ncbi:unnamed protein product [Cylindrotheca closterium]|uniref:guanylate cyclase n=1 Tax=Cylindrotheca closterium TaxID=2856 RepID=A0AAD2FHM1_9STRA|nr:unnamed protein product [Cylindrotheca closterium]